MTTEEVINMWSKWYPHDTDDELRWDLWGTMKRGRGRQRRLREEIQMGRIERAVGTGLDTVHLRAARHRGEVEDDLEVVVGYEDAPLHERSSYNHTEVNGGELCRSLLSSPDHTIIQVDPRWTTWLKNHAKVEYEWCTTWYGMARVRGVNSRVVGNLPKALTGGQVTAAWDEKGRSKLGTTDGGTAATGVVTLRGWERTGAMGAEGVRVGYIPPLTGYVMSELAKSQVSQYMFIATRSEGHIELKQRVAEHGGQIIMKIPHGRIGQREAWWPGGRSKHNDTIEDTIKTGHGGEGSQRTKRRRTCGWYEWDEQRRTPSLTNSGQGW
jgi:hypothetical protein